MGYTADHRRRIERLEDELLRRPTYSDVDDVREKLRRREAMCNAAIARNEILVRKLRDAEQRIRELQKVAA